MKHAFRIEITTHSHAPRGHVERIVQFVEAGDFDPENRNVGALSQWAWDEILANSSIQIALDDAAEGCRTEDDRFTAWFDGACIADECLWHVDRDYFDDAWAARHEKVAA